MTNEKYNGWTNRETWAANLIITNNESIFRVVKVFNAKSIKTMFENAHYYHSVGQHEASIVPLMPVMSIGSLDRVNWDEIATALKGE